MKVSICIPTYDSDNSNIEYIKECLESCLIQNYVDFEIVVSDHSPTDSVRILLSNYNCDNIKYFKYTENIGYPAHNTNNAISNSDGDLIKIMNQDDYFINSSALSKMVDGAKTNKWSLTSFVHLNDITKEIYHPMIPRLPDDDKDLLKGINTIGCPSVGLFPKENIFDTNVMYMIDCDLWYNLYRKYGNPAIITDYDLVIRMGEHNLTFKLREKQQQMIDNDINYLNKKYQI